MNDHPLISGHNIPAICPKCGQAKLRRSHSTSKFEEIKKKYSFRRPFRCLQCGWRGWVDETHLHYAVIPESKVEGEEDVAIPDFSFEEEIDVEQLYEETLTDDALETAEEEDFQNIPAGIVMTTDETDTVQTQLKKPLGQELQVPDFDMDSSEPYVQMVSDSFHHEGRHKVKGCPNCGEFSLYRSKARTIGETLLKKLISKRPYRCHTCGWRGWLSRTF